jgi:hypothetical protein
MAYSDNRWDLATAGRVFVLKLRDLADEVSEVLNNRAYFARNRRYAKSLLDAKLVKPASYKARS